MNQSAVIGASLIVAYAVFVVYKGELPCYFAVLGISTGGSGCPQNLQPPGCSTGGSSGSSPTTTGSLGNTLGTVGGIIGIIGGIGRCITSPASCGLGGLPIGGGGGGIDFGGGLGLGGGL